MIQIEDREGVEELEAIAQVPGLDVIFCGPYDLSRSMGQIGDLEHPDVKCAVESIVDAAAAKKACVPGMYVGTPEGAAEWQGRGARLFAYGADMGFLSNGAKEAFETIAHLR
jgi:2-keto-3-deoxy-L-rhamnonate aldolase RhmA